MRLRSCFITSRSFGTRNLNWLPEPILSATVTESATQVKVVVLGAGFGGLELCKRLRRENVAITLVDRQNHHLFQPLLYQVATAGLSATDIAQPIRAILEKQKNVTVLMDEVRSIDLTARRVRTGHHDLAFDYLVIALGVTPHYFGNDGWARWAPGLKRLTDATLIRANVLSAFERAESSDDPDEIAELLTIVVVGGGPTGVELAGAFAELSRKALSGSFRRIDTTKTRIILIEASDRILGMYSPELSAYAEKKLLRLGVEVRTNSPVLDITENTVVLEGERIASRNIVWSAGVAAPSLTQDLGVALDRSGRIHVQADLSIPSHPGVFAIGDIASCTDRTGIRVPPLAPAAIQAGRHVARIIRNETRALGDDLTPYGDTLRPGFAYFDKGTMATIGRSAAVAASMGLTFRGLVAWVMWLFIHLLLLIGLRNKLSVLLQWAWAYLHYKPGARIIIQAAERAAPAAWRFGSGSEAPRNR